MRTSLASVALAVLLCRPLANLEAQADSLIAVRLPVALPEAQARVTRAMIAEGLSVSDTTSGLVIGQGTEKGNTLNVKYAAVILARDSFSEVTISAVTTAKAQPGGARIERRVTSKLKDARNVWAAMQRIAERVVRAPPVSAYPATPALGESKGPPSVPSSTGGTGDLPPAADTNRVVGRTRANEQLVENVGFQQAAADVQRLGIVAHYRELRPDTLTVELGDAAFTSASLEYNLSRLYRAYRGTTDYGRGGALELQHGGRRVGLYTKSGLTWEAER